MKGAKMNIDQRDELFRKLCKYGDSIRGSKLSTHETRQDVESYVDQLITEAYEAGKRAGACEEHSRTWGAP